VSRDTTTHTLVLDIGKTNKKIVIFDQTGSVVHIEKRDFQEVLRHGLRIEPMKRITEWFFSRLKMLAKDYPIATINVSAHAAAFVLVDSDGTPLAPVLSYLNEPAPDVFAKLKDIVGDPEDLYRNTCTPRLRQSVNLAIGFMNAQHYFPSVVANATSVVCLPHYFVMLLTSKRVAELTYLGCHTYLWDFACWRWSALAERIGYAALSPHIVPTTTDTMRVPPDTSATLHLDRTMTVMPGIHDSNASLVPYMMEYGRAFCLHSTGSWCVTMMPSLDTKLSKKEMTSSVFYNIDVTGRPVKTHTYPAGIILNRELERLPAEYRGEYELAVLSRIIRERKVFFLPSHDERNPTVVLENQRLDPDNYLSLVNSGDGSARIAAVTYHALVVAGLSCAICTDLIGFDLSGIEHIFVDGGFKQNRYYLAVFAAFFSDKKVYTSSVEEATAFGAALVRHGGSEVSGSILSRVKKRFAESLFLDAALLESYRTQWCVCAPPRTTR